MTEQERKAKVKTFLDKLKVEQAKIKQQNLEFNKLIYPNTKQQ